MDGQVVEAGLDVVIGMGALVARLDRTVLAPWRAAIGDTAGIEGAPRGTVPHSVLLYGAPGSGVRFAASSLAAALDRRAERHLQVAGLVGTQQAPRARHRARRPPARPRVPHRKVRFRVGSGGLSSRVKTWRGGLGV